MRRIWIDSIRMLLSLSALFLSASCQIDIQDFGSGNGSGRHEVGIYAGGARTRTEMLSNGLSAVWTAGDNLAVWARSSAGSFALSGQVFTTYGIDSEKGYFKSDLASAMEDGRYTYYCCYPVPSSVNGTEVIFNLPSVQDGKASGGSDIMIASPVEHGPLSWIPEYEDHSGLSLHMNRMMHQFRFFVPSDNTVLGDEEITRIVLTFPAAVVGNVALDVSDPNAEAVLSDASGVISMELSDPVGLSSEDEPEYACAVLAPSSFSPGQMLDIKAYTSSKVVLVDPVDLCGRTFEAGHSTPVRLNVRSIADYPYQMIFTITANNLGEGVNSIIFTAPEGCVWPSSGTNVYEYRPGHKITAGDQIAIRFFDAAEYMAFSNKDIQLTFDSDHAMTTASSHVSPITISGNTHVTNITAAVPYLFEENFSTLVTYNGDYKGGPYTSVSGATTAGQDLSQYGLRSGWTGARTGCDAAGTAILVGGRVDCVIAGATRAYGRLDSPALSCIKPDVSTGIKVTFDYSGNRDDDYSHYYTAGVCGTTTESGVLSGYATQFNNDPSWTGVYDFVTIPDIPLTGSASSMSKSMTMTFAECDAATRLSWHAVVMGYKSWKIDNEDGWMYIDNVKVQIANQ